MENAVDALKMAGAVLIFVIALSISIVSFGQVRQASDVILNYKDRETVYIDGDYYYEATGTERTVGLETVIPSIYRAYNEQYKIVFQFADGRPIYKCTYSSGNYVERSVLDSAFEYDEAVITTEDRNQNILPRSAPGMYRTSAPPLPLSLLLPMRAALSQEGSVLLDTCLRAPALPLPPTLRHYTRKPYQNNRIPRL